MKKVYPDLANAMTEILQKMGNFLLEGGYNGPPINMYLAGGMAVNYYCGTRYTEDIDASFSRRVLFSPDEIAVDYMRSDGKKSFIYLDTNYNPTFALMHENFEAESLPWDESATHSGLINLRVLSPIDLAVSKISRFSERDREDIKALAIEGLITESALRERAEDALLDYVGNLVIVKNSINIACNDIKQLTREQIKSPLPNVDPQTSGTHIGPIVSVDRNSVVQSVGRGQVVTHDARNLSAIPKVGDSATIAYKDGKGAVFVREQGQCKDLGR